MIDEKEKTALATSVGADERQSIQPYNDAMRGVLMPLSIAPICFAVHPTASASSSCVICAASLAVFIRFPIIVRSICRPPFQSLGLIYVGM